MIDFTRNICFSLAVSCFYLVPIGSSFASDPVVDCKHATSDYDMGPCSYRDFKNSTEALEHIESNLRKMLRYNKQALRIFEIDASDWKQYMLNRCSDAVLGFNEDGEGITTSIARGYCKSDLMNKRVDTLKHYVH